MARQKRRKSPWGRHTTPSTKATKSEEQFFTSYFAHSSNPVGKILLRSWVIFTWSVCWPVLAGCGSLFSFLLFQIFAWTKLFFLSNNWDLIDSGLNTRPQHCFELRVWVGQNMWEVSCFQTEQCEEINFLKTQTLRWGQTDNKSFFKSTWDGNCRDVDQFNHFKQFKL